ncbi:MAG: GAF domain-containing protein [Desulfobacterales bacterium]|nr:GAF domain-containing protein [Desulfobacterales bacterium]
MSRILKKLIRKNEVISLISSLTDILESPVSVVQSDGRILMGEEGQTDFIRYPISVDDNLFGWVCGQQGANVLADLLAYLAAQELEKRALVQETLDKYKEINLLYNISEKIAASLDLEKVAKLVIDEALRSIEGTSASVILLDEITGKFEIISEFGRKHGSKTSLVPGKGIAGNVFINGKAEIVNDVPSDPRYIKGNKKENSMICAPLKTNDRTIGVIRISSDTSVRYTAADLRLLTTLASLTASAIENSRIYRALEDAYEELKILNKAKDKMINHLSHELKTPLAIIKEVFATISRKLMQAGQGGFDKTINRGSRNLERLLKIQEEIQDILDLRHQEEKHNLIKFMEDILSFTEALEENKELRTDIFRSIAGKIESVYEVGEIIPEEIALDEFLDDICDNAMTSIHKSGRDLDIIRDITKGICIDMDKNVLTKVCSGLLRNAIENSPDQGKIVVSLYNADNTTKIQFHDYGVGITENNQKLIFGGFYHTQDTSMYSTKRPYEFNAGGSGSDLLRTKIFSQRHGFSINFRSTRCRYIPNESDSCPGKISDCEFVRDRGECFASGETIFLLDFVF